MRRPQKNPPSIRALLLAAIVTACSGCDQVQDLGQSGDLGPGAGSVDAARPDVAQATTIDGRPAEPADGATIDAPIAGDLSPATDTLTKDATVDTLAKDSTVDTLAKDSTVDALAKDATVDTLAKDATVDVALPPDAGSGTCISKTQSCSYFSSVYPSASFKDEDSFRRVVVETCYKATGKEQLVVEDCAYDETCAGQPGPTYSCQGCGHKGKNTAFWSEDGVVKQDCEGCGCFGWTVYCQVAGSPYGEPYIRLTWQEGYKVMQFDIGKSGAVHFDNPTPGVTTHLKVSLLKADFSPGGEVDLEIDTRRDATDNLGLLHKWIHQARVAKHCK